jgi:hypothetical protein
MVAAAAMVSLRFFGFTPDNSRPAPKALAAVNSSIFAVHAGTEAVSPASDGCAAD